MAFNVKNVNPKSAVGIAIIAAVVIGVVFLIYWVNKTFGGISGLFSSVTDKLGITDSPVTTAKKAAIDAAKQETANPGSPWSPTFYQNAPTGTNIFTSAYADQLCEQIWDSVGIFTAYAEEAYGAIKECSTKAKVSFVCDRFNQKYQKDLYSWLVMQYTVFGTPDTTLVQLTQYVNNLPNYNA